MPTNNTENLYSTEFENDPNPIPSTRIGYDNTTSGLTATTVQGAIDELADEKQDKSYDNTTSGLTATTVQGAIDEVVSIAESKMQYVSVSEPTNIFDLIQNADGSTIYAAYSPKFTNGADDFMTLLSVSQYARVELFCYSKNLAVIRVVNVDGIFAIAYINANSTEIKFMKVTTTGNSIITVTPST